MYLQCNIGDIFLIQSITSPVSKFTKGLLMAHRAETCSLKYINKTSLMCDCFNTYTCDLLTTTAMSYVKVMEVISFKPSNRSQRNIF